MRQEWLSLLNESDADSMFLSPYWLGSWWDAWGSKQSDTDPLILVARNGTDKLVGLAPLYTSRDSVRGKLSIDRVQFLGGNFRRSGITRTEYLDFVLDPTIRRVVLEKLLEHLFQNFEFDEFVIADLRLDSPTHIAIKQHAHESDSLLRIVDPATSTRIHLDETFEHFLANLGRNTRLRVFNRRKVLNSLGDVEVFQYDRSNYLEGFKELSRLFQDRWGHPVFTAAQLEFQELLINRLPSDSNLRLTGITLDGKCISVALNIEMEKIEYNFLLGFAETLHPKLSLGMLHLGYAIEASFADEIKHFDLLLGSGKHSDYKRNFRGAVIEAETLQVIRRPFYKWLYRSYDFFHRKKKTDKP